MAIGLGIAAIVVSVIGAGYGMYMLRQQKGVPSAMADMQPNSLDAFQVTKMTEGIVVPVVFGRVKISGNILWYGNFEAVENIATSVQEVQDGKSTKTVVQEYVESHSYYLSVWQLLCEGPAEILNGWVNDKNIELPDPTLVEALGDGTNAAVVATLDPVDDAAVKPLEGIAWIYLPRQFLGVNTTNVQTLHFLMESNPGSIYTIGGSPFPTPSFGVSPAQIIYALLMRAGADILSFNEASFIASATYWNSVDYGLNMSFTAQTPVRAQISQVLSYVGGFFGTDSQGLFRLKAFDPNEASVDSLSEVDFIDFQFSRESWSSTFNTFTGNYIDKNQSYTKRTVSSVNTANLEIVGSAKPMSVDLSAFTDRASANRRIWEIMKEHSYPKATISFTTFLDKAALEVGDVIQVSHSDYGMVNEYYRVISKGNALIDENKLSFTASQIVERITNAGFLDVPGSGWTEIDTEPDAPVHQRAFELPWGFEDTTYAFVWGTPFLLLTARGSSAEIGFVLYASYLGPGDYVKSRTYSTNSYQGELVDTYPVTDEIDDEIGILITPHLGFIPFEGVARATLFRNTRYALIGNEIITYQDAVPEGLNDYRLTGVIRGLFNTIPVEHTSTTEIWLFYSHAPIYGDLWNWTSGVKMAPRTASSVYDVAFCPAHAILYTGKFQRPTPIPRLVGVRTGVNVVFEWWPISKTSSIGAGVGDPGDVDDYTWHLTDDYPMHFDGAFEYSTNGSTWINLVDTTVTINNAAGYTFYIREVVDGYTGNTKTLVVGVSDGTYKS